MRSVRVPIRSVSFTDEALVAVSLLHQLAYQLVMRTLQRGDIFQGLVDPFPPLFLFRRHNDIIALPVNCDAQSAIPAYRRQ